MFHRVGPATSRWRLKVPADHPKARRVAHSPTARWPDARPAAAECHRELAGIVEALDRASSFFVGYHEICVEQDYDLDDTTLRLIDSVRRARQAARRLRDGLGRSVDGTEPGC